MGCNRKCGDRLKLFSRFAAAIALLVYTSACSPKLIGGRSLEAALAAASSSSGSGSGTTIVDYRGFQFAQADFDNDGDVDVVIVDTTNDEIEFYGNNGSGVFVAGAAVVVGDAPMAVVAGDFNHNGNVDIAVTNSGDDDVTILAGQGDGTFVAALDYAVGGEPSGIAVADLDRDGLLDLVVANYATDNVSFLSGNGNNTFDVAVNTTVGDGPLGVAIGDKERDGDLDVIVTNYNAGTVSVLANNGSGVLAASQTLTAQTEPTSVIALDVSQDGELDVIVANSGSSSVSVFIEDGAGSLAAATNITVGTNPSSLIATRWDADGVLDLVVANRGSNNRSVLLGAGAGAFGAATSTALTGTAPIGLGVADFNRSGESDALFLNATGLTVVELVAGAGTTGAGTFAAGVTYSTDPGNGDVPMDAAIADFDKDGDLDMAVTSSSDSRIAYFANNGNGTFAAVALTNTNDPVCGPVSIKAFDNLRNGNLDIVYNCYDHNDLVYGPGNGAGVFGGAIAEPINIGGAPRVVELGDFNHDGIVDAVMQNDNADVTLHPGQVGGGFANETAFATNGGGAYSVAVGDVNHDGNLDVVAVTPGDDEAELFLGNGTVGGGALVASTVVATCNFPRSVGLADFTRDGHLDLIVGCAGAAQDIRIHPGDGAGAFAAGTTVNSCTDPGYNIAISDFNSDGFLDVVVGCEGDTDVGVHLNNGAGSFGALVPYDVGGVAYYAEVGDLNADGKVDIVSTRSDGADVVVFLGN